MRIFHFDMEPMEIKSPKGIATTSVTINSRKFIPNPSVRAERIDMTFSIICTIPSLFITLKSSAETHFLRCHISSCARINYFADNTPSNLYFAAISASVPSATSSEMMLLTFSVTSLPFLNAIPYSSALKSAASTTTRSS